MGIWDKLLGNGVGAAAEGLGSLSLDIREAIKGKEVEYAESNHLFTFIDLSLHL